MSCEGIFSGSSSFHPEKSLHSFTGVGNVILPKNWAHGTPDAPRKLKFRQVKTSLGAYMTVVKDSGEFKRVILSIPMNKSNSIWGMVDSRKNLEGADKDTLEDLEF